LKECGLDIISGGTDSHLSVIDLTKLSINGKIAAEELDKVGITCNKNAIPFDNLPPSQTSGIRIGSAAMTTRGFGKNEFVKTADLIYKVLSSYGKLNCESVKDEVKAETLNLCKQFPLYK
jgi:glycine hydroxymethyltransferase